MSLFGFDLLTVSAATSSFVSGEFDDNSSSPNQENPGLPEPVDLAESAPLSVIELELNSADDSSQDDGLTIVSSAASVSEDWASCYPEGSRTEAVFVASSSIARPLSISTADSEFVSVERVPELQDLRSSAGSEFLSLHPSSLASSVITNITFSPPPSSASCTVASSLISIPLPRAINPALLPPALPGNSFFSAGRSLCSEETVATNMEWVEVNRVFTPDSSVIRLQIGDTVLTLPESIGNHNKKWYEQIKTEEDWSAFCNQALSVLAALGDCHSELSPEQFIGLLIQQEEDYFWAQTEASPRRKFCKMWPLYPGVLAVTAAFASVAVRMLVARR